MAIPKKVAARELVIRVEAVIDFDERAVEIICSWPSSECGRGPDIRSTGTMAVAVAQIVQVQNDRIDDACRLAVNTGNDCGGARGRRAAESRYRLRVIGAGRIRRVVQRWNRVN